MQIKQSWLKSRTGLLCFVLNIARTLLLLVMLLYQNYKWAGNPTMNYMYL